LGKAFYSCLGRIKLKFDFIDDSNRSFDESTERWTRQACERRTVGGKTGRGRRRDRRGRGGKGIEASDAGGNEGLLRDDRGGRDRIRGYRRYRQGRSSRGGGGKIKRSISYTRILRNILGSGWTASTSFSSFPLFLSPLLLIPVQSAPARRRGATDFASNLDFTLYLSRLSRISSRTYLSLTWAVATSSLVTRTIRILSHPPKLRHVTLSTLPIPLLLPLPLISSCNSLSLHLLQLRSIDIKRPA